MEAVFFSNPLDYNTFICAWLGETQCHFLLFVSRWITATFLATPIHLSLKHGSVGMACGTSTMHDAVRVHARPCLLFRLPGRSRSRLQPLHQRAVPGRKRRWCVFERTQPRGITHDCDGRGHGGEWESGRGSCRRVDAMSQTKTCMANGR